MSQSPNTAPMLQQALALHQQGRLAEAEPIYRTLLKIAPTQFDALHYLGVLKLQQGKFDEAVALITEALRARPDAVDALSNRGIALQSLGRYEDAIKSYDRALARKSDHADALFNRGNALQALGRYGEALSSYDRALKVRPGFPPALANRGNTLQVLGRHEEAIASYDHALTLRPGSADVLNNRANAARALRRTDVAIADYRSALVLRPDYPEALTNLGIALMDKGEVTEAIACHRRATALGPDLVEAHLNLGNALAVAGHGTEAIDCFDRVLALQPTHADARYARGSALHALGRYEEAIADFDRVLAIKPRDANALHSRGNVQREWGRHAEALASYEQALEADPDAKYLLGDLAYARASLCDWTDRAHIEQRMEAGLRAGKALAAPFVALMLADPAVQLACAAACVADRYPPAVEPLWKGEGYVHDRIRVAYLSADLHDHAMAYLMAGLFERHDRARFEVTALSSGRSRESEMRSRLVAAFEHFVDIRAMSDLEAAQLIRAREIDIVVDCQGYTENARPAILAHRPAPVQASYLGYPGTMGADYIDYIIADEWIIPRGDTAFYTEKIVWLPHCYQVNDSQRRIAERTPTRDEVGLPPRGFVFCCFNNNFKLTPQFFDIWMRVLKRVDASVLWLLRSNDQVERNLRHEAVVRGVDPQRLVFASRVPLAEHLARHRLADLFVDTLPYNAHTTASDALWAGLPVLTCTGQAFAGRVAGSLLDAIGLPEMITHSLEQYEHRAVELATRRDSLAEIAGRLGRNRASEPLFDTDLFRRHIESAYAAMWKSRQRGELPANITVAPIVA